MLIFALPATAGSREKIAVINVAGTSLLTYLSCVVQKKMRPRTCLAAGAVAGAGFYQSKRLVSRGDITTGWLVANVSSSIVENTAAGAHPLSRIGYTFGPLRFRVSTPAEKNRQSWIDIDVSAAETGYLARALNDADDVDVRDGMIWYETREPRREDDVVFHGYTWGVFPGTWSRAASHTWRHEAVHVVQAQQLDSFDPPVLTLQRKPRIVRIRHLRAGALNLLDNAISSRMPYEDRWSEIEAFRLVQNRRPPQ